MKQDSLPPPILRPPKTRRQAIVEFRSLLIWWIQHGMPEDLACDLMKHLDALPVTDQCKSIASWPSQPADCRGELQLD
jgi:hypothetical protein